MTKAKAKRVRAKVGDVFAIPISSDERIYGQVVAQSGVEFLVVVFHSNSASVEEAMRSGLALAGIVFDAKLRNGDWPIVANLRPVRTKAPWFVLGHDGLENLRIENFDGSQTRMVRLAEAATHHHRHLSDPMVLQLAAEALHGQREWKDGLDFLRDLARELSGDAGSD
jgi:Immunity protein 26